MGLYEDAIALREKINDAAPEAYKQELRDKPWALALLCAESYFKEHKPSGNKTEEGNKLERHTVVSLYAEGRSVEFISLYFNISKEKVVEWVRTVGMPVYAAPRVSLNLLHEENKDGFLNAYHCQKIYGYIKQAAVPDFVEPLMYEPDEHEVAVIKKLLSRSDVRAVAKACNRPMQMIEAIKEHD